MAGPSCSTKRIRSGCVLDGHGDLLADDIYCLDDGPRILDCLEFSDRLRWGDVLYDVGFSPWTSNDSVGPTSLPRSWTGTESSPPRFIPRPSSTTTWRIEPWFARRYPAERGARRSGRGVCLLAQCLRHLRTAQIRLAVVGGLPGTGKSTIAMELGDQLGWPVLRSDVLRKQRRALRRKARADVSFKEGLYSPSTSGCHVRRALSKRRNCSSSMGSQSSSTLFSRSKWRAAAAAMASHASAVLVELRCTVPSDIAADRLRERGIRGSRRLRRRRQHRHRDAERVPRVADRHRRRHPITATHSWPHGYVNSWTPGRELTGSTHGGSEPVSVRPMSPSGDLDLLWRHLGGHLVGAPRPRGCRPCSWPSRRP